jgi:hypothetical protein
MNEAFRGSNRGFGGPGRRGPGGPGGPGGPPAAAPQESGGPFALDPLVAASDASKPLISKLLAVPALRQRYLGYVREIATVWLDWDKLGPIATGFHELIDAEVKDDTKKLASYDAFVAARDELRTFAEGRRKFLLDHAAIKALGEKSE